MSLSSSKNEPWTHLILHSRHGNCSLNFTWYSRENSSSIVPLLLTLSQVTWPSYMIWSGKIKWFSNLQMKYLVRDTNTIKNLKQSTTEALPVVCIIDFGKTKECTFALPLWGYRLFNPMTCDRKVTISITSLPRITCNIYCPANSLTLHINQQTRSIQSYDTTYIKCLFQYCKMVLEHSHNFSSSGLPTGDFDTIGCLRCYINHFFEFRMFKCLNGLEKYRYNSDKTYKKADILDQLIRATQ